MHPAANPVQLDYSAMHPHSQMPESETILACVTTVRRTLPCEYSSMLQELATAKWGTPRSQVTNEVVFGFFEIGLALEMQRQLAANNVESLDGLNGNRRRVLDEILAAGQSTAMDFLREGRYMEEYWPVISKYIPTRHRTFS